MIALTPPMTPALPFGWYRNSDVEFTGADPGQVFHVSQASAQ